jgi:hypothetical protein
MTARHYGMDWLRICAFGLLIFYHIGMFFVHWDWHVKTADPVEWVAVPMLALNPWRLPLLFVVSGFASRALMARTAGPGAFVRSRSARLLIPLAVGMVLIVPPQPWVEMVVEHGYQNSYPFFWLNDYFRFGAIADDLIVPTWQHLWFVVYLWVYSLLIAVATPLGRRVHAQTWFDRWFARKRASWIVLAWFVLAQGVLARGQTSTNALVDDWPGHIIFLPAFLFGFALARSETAWAGIRRWWHVAALIAAMAYSFVAGVELLYPGRTPIPVWLELPYFSIRAAQGAAGVIALIGMADRFWNRDHPVRATLNEAVFPFYIIHQTAIVVAGWYLLRFRLPPLAEFAILLVVTTVACLLFYLAGRRVGWLRPLIGLK